MAGQSLGGYFVEIGAKTNKNSFESALKSIDGIGNSITRLVGTVRNAAPLLLAAAAGVVETAELKASKAIGISTEALDAWKTSAAIAGTNANALVSDMTALERKMQGLKLGQVDAGLAQSLGFLNLGYGEFADMSATERIAEVFERAGQLEDQKKAALLVGNILGGAALDYYYYLQLSGKSLQEQLAFADRLVFTTEDSKKNAMVFNGEMQALKEGSKSIMNLLGGELGGQLLPFMTALTGFLANNHDGIQNGIIGVVDTLGELGEALTDGVDFDKIKSAMDSITGAFSTLIMAITKEDSTKEGLKEILRSLGEFGGDAIKAAATTVGALVEALAALINLDWEKLGESLKKVLGGVGDLGEAAGNAVGALLTGQTPHEFEVTAEARQEAMNALWKETREKNKNVKKKFEDFSPETQALVNAAGGPTNPSFKNFIKDGVIGPDGRVIQVDPNDWVFAAKDLGDLARGFVPTATSGGTSIQYTIEQTINVNGNGASAFDIRRQAYEGTSKALLDNIAQSSRRLQLMPATK